MRANRATGNRGRGSLIEAIRTMLRSIPVGPLLIMVVVFVEVGSVPRIVLGIIHGGTKWL